jgi:hypothetical protein
MLQKISVKSRSFLDSLCQEVLYRSLKHDVEIYVLSSFLYRETHKIKSINIVKMRLKKTEYVPVSHKVKKRRALLHAELILVYKYKTLVLFLVLFSFSSYIFFQLQNNEDSL